MPLSNSVLRRYTPPTCTLQLVARSSPLSRWMGRSVATLLQFDLRFDDPRLPEEQRVHIQGDREQLEALHEAVATYVRDLLNQSPARFNAVLSALAPPSSDSAVSSTPPALDLNVDDSQALSEEFRPLDFSHTSAEFDSASQPKNPTARAAGKIFLQPGRGLSHDLFLGALATMETGPVIHLSVLQLFDLATALDEYAADVVALPTLSRPRLAAAPPAWAGIAAVLLLAVGLTTGVQLLNRSGSRQQTATRLPTQRSSSNDQQPLALPPSPVPTLGMPTPPLSSLETLPPLPPVGSTVVPSPSPIPSGTVSSTTPALKNTPRANVPQRIPVTPINPRADVPQATPVIPIPQITPPPPILINPTLPSSPVAPPSAAIPSPSPQVTTPNRDLEAALSRATRGAASPESSDTPATKQRGDSAPQGQLRSTLTAPNEPKSTAFAPIPQVAEVRNYFNQNWEPPSGLSQTLEYSIVLDVNGTIQRIEPLGQASRTYVDRTGMPLIGERFVSPNERGQTPRIRVVLAPDGKVRTFLEPD